MNGLDNTKVEVRLHDVSCHVPVAIDDPAMSTVRNQSIFLSRLQVILKAVGLLLHI